MTFDPNYRMRFRPTPIFRLSKYTFPPPMTGNPEEARGAMDWDKRCRLVYEHMMAVKRGIISPERRRGLWQWTERA